jgi:hypothetical protein
VHAEPDVDLQQNPPTAGTSAPVVVVVRATDEAS